MGLTLKEIARYAGVSVGTASRVINGKTNVSEALRLRVEAVIDKLNYSPNAMARSVRRNKTDVIGLVIPKVKSEHYMQLIYAYERYVSSKDHALFLVCSDEDPEKELKYLESFMGLRIGGLILSTSTRPDDSRLPRMLERYREMGIPVVTIMRTVPFGRVDEVVVDDLPASEEAVMQMIAEGHRRIAAILSPSYSSSAQRRLEGYSRALNQHGIALDGDLIQSIDDTREETSYHQALSLLRMSNPPTAIFVAASFPLVGTLNAIRDSGARIPQDISVVCFDDPDWASFVSPPLSAVRPHIQELCSRSVDYLFSRMEGGYTGDPRVERVGAELVWRDSVGPAPLPAHDRN